MGWDILFWWLILWYDKCNKFVNIFYKKIVSWGYYEKIGVIVFFGFGFF